MKVYWAHLQQFCRTILVTYLLICKFINNLKFWKLKSDSESPESGGSVSDENVESDVESESNDSDTKGTWVRIRDGFTVSLEGFKGNPGVRHARSFDDSFLEYFKLYFDDDFFQRLVDRTNKYADDERLWLLPETNAIMSARAL